MERIKISQEQPEASRKKELPFLKSLNQVEAYKEWKKTVDSDLRGMVEQQLLGGGDARISKDNGPLARQFLSGFNALLQNPETDIRALEVDERVKKQLALLREVAVKEDEVVDIYKLFSGKEPDFALLTDYYNKKVKARFDWIKFQDARDAQKYVKENGKMEVSGDREDEKYEPHRQPMGEQKEKIESAIAAVYPFYGGYYKDAVFSRFDSDTLVWSKEGKKFVELSKQEIDEAKKRIYRTAILSNSPCVIKLPYGWGVNQESASVNGKREHVRFLRDQSGLVYVQIEDADGESGEFQVEIGPTKNVFFGEPGVKDSSVKDNLPGELGKYLQETAEARISGIARGRKIVSFIRSHLEYDKDDFALEQAYKRDKSKYFVAIWENKKAKCDEANTLAARALAKAGFIVRFISGHSVQSKSEKGEALLLDSNRHAWLEVFDEERKEWVRMDATPKGDPNVDEEEQKEDLGEGDYGERDAEIMSDEELEKVLREMEKKEDEESQRPEIVFAKEAGCSTEEAKQVLERIVRLRERHRKVLQESGEYWKRVLRKNLKEDVEYSGPVRQSEGDELEDIVSARIDVRTGVDDPIGFEKQFKEIKVEKLFGGYEVYLMADMSGSMADSLNGVRKSEAQRDMVFLLIDSIMTSAAVARRAERKLKVPMPNKVCLTVFGGTTEVVLPVTDKWGPVEQIKVFRALDKPANGSTPDDEALRMIDAQVNSAKKAETEIREKKAKGKEWKIRRFVIATADGGSNNYARVKAANDNLLAKGIPVDLFLIGAAEDDNLVSVARTVYQSATPISDVSLLAERGLDALTRRIKETYGE